MKSKTRNGSWLTESRDELVFNTLLSQMTDPTRDGHCTDGGMEWLWHELNVQCALMEEAIQTSDTTPLEEYLCWLKSMAGELRFPGGAVDHLFHDLARSAIARGGPRDADAIREVARRVLRQAPNPPATPAFAPQKNLHRRIVTSALVHLRRFDARSLERTLVRPVESGRVKPLEFLMDVVVPLHREVGRLWHEGVITPAEEHLCCDISRRAMDRIMTRERERLHGAPKAGRLLIACPSGEHHEMPARIVGHVFELARWDVIQLGANTPSAALMHATQQTRPDVIALSASNPAVVPHVRESINATRSHFRKKTPRIIVGGYPFVTDPTLADEAGADAFAQTALEALAIAEIWMGRRAPYALTPESPV